LESIVKDRHTIRCNGTQIHLTEDCSFDFARLNYELFNPDDCFSIDHDCITFDETVLDRELLYIKVCCSCVEVLAILHIHVGKCDLLEAGVDSVKTLEYVYRWKEIETLNLEINNGITCVKFVEVHYPKVRLRGVSR
jgi:hypothetical protein